jgi:4-amino-4-deoxy-L-arabinose transferase-like glycosyltransferase
MFRLLEKILKKNAPTPGAGARDETMRTKRSAVESFVVEEIELSGGPEVAAPQRKIWPPRWWPQARLAAGWIGLWAVLTAATLAGRSAWPVDETRVLAIAWEMWSGGLLVPGINGEPLAHAPLLFWLIHLFWLAFGVEALAARAVPPLFALGSLILLAALARRLWPENPLLARHAPYLLLGAFGFALAAPLALPAMPLVFFTLLALFALMLMWRARDARAWLLLAAALALGLLASGPLAPIYVVPLALSAPLWARGPARPKWRHWYADIGKALLVATLVFALWLVPAALRAGPLYALEAATGALRLATLEPFALEQPFWWYLFAGALVFLPWSVSPLLWMRFWHMRRAPIGAPLAFCMLWIALPLAVLSAFAAKQPQFLLPLLPAGALIVGWLLYDPQLAEREESPVFSGLAIPLIVLGAGLAVIPKLPRLEALPPMLWELSPFVGVAVVLLGIVTALLPSGRRATRRALDTAIGSALFAALLALALGWQFDEHQRVAPLAEAIARAQAEGRTVAHVGDYRGEFHFDGRLTRRLQVLDTVQARQWPVWHPEGAIITYGGQGQPAHGATPLFQGSYRGQAAALWRCDAFAPRSGVPAAGAGGTQGAPSP